jgi:CheY-like chemotaxis protein
MAKLLVLDDEPGTLEWMTAALSALGHEVRGYESGRAALAAIDDFHPDLILADILMPEMDGFAFTRLVRAHRGPRVLFISVAQRQADAILAGAVGYVAKPATAAEIRSAVGEVLGHEPRRATILVVDDDPDTRLLYREILEREFQVVEADDGVAGLEAMHRQPVDLVISDFHMPNMNGVQFIRAIRSDGTLKHVPIIVETSDRVALTSPVWHELGVAYQIDKTVFMRWLDKTIGSALASQPHH